MAVTFSSGNLIVNPGAELGDAAANFSTTVAPQGWLTTEHFTAVAYDAGSTGDLNPTSGRNLQGGKNYFAGGTQSLASTAVQTIDVSGYAAEIDAGGISAKLSGQFGGFSSQTDRMSLTARFLGSGGGALGEVTVGPVTAGERQSESTLLGRFGSVEIPEGTRSIEVKLTAIRDDGNYNDGYADNLGLSLVGLDGGFVQVAGNQNFSGETIGPSQGIAFDPQFNSTAVFASSQFGVAGIAAAAAIQGSFAADRLVINTGTGESFSAAAFTFDNWTNGRDRLTLQGRGGNETITGTAMNDTMLGAAGKDTLKGGAGNDSLAGGAGIDTVVGGRGKDSFTLSDVAADRDTIRDFSHAKDQLAVSAALFGAGLVKGEALGTKFEANATGQAAGAEDRFVYDTATGKLYFDADGNGSGTAELIATLTGAPVIDSSDIDILA